LHYLPRLYEDTHTGSKENHPTRVLVVVDEIQQDDGLNHHISDNLTMNSIAEVSVNYPTRTVLEEDISPKSDGLREIHTAEKRRPSPSCLSSG